MTEKMESIDNKTCPIMQELKDLNLGFYKAPNMENKKAPNLGNKTGPEFSKTYK